MTNQLPLIPNLEYLRNQAKDLLALCRVGDSNAIKQIRQLVPEFRELPLVELASSIRLHHTQEAVARRYEFGNWSQLCESVGMARSSVVALSSALEDPRMDDLDYRTRIARAKGLPAIGTSRVSEHGVRYDVVDYMPAISCEGAARVRAGGPEAHINDLLPIIAFPEMSDRLYDRLYELYIETDCVTSKPLIFFDTVPLLHQSTAAPGLNQVVTPSAETPLYFHFDATQLHETIIAHELGHVWVEMVEQCEDFRHPRDQSDLTRTTQFYHIQSFVMDLRVNDMLARRGFDMSIIAHDQAESIVNFGAKCARGEKPKNRRVLAAVINAIAGALLEMERFPNEWSTGIRDAFEMIQIGLPEAFEPAKGFVRSVLRHGYADSNAVMRVVDDCARLSFAATGDRFDPEKDLIEVLSPEPNWDKRPDFLSCLPLSAKLEVCRATARQGITGRAAYNIVVSYPHHASVVVTDPDGTMAEPIRLSYNLPAPPPNPNRMPGAPVPNLPVGSAYIPPPGSAYPGTTSHTPARQAPFACNEVPTTQFVNSSKDYQNSRYLPPLPTPPDPYKGLPDEVRALLQPIPSPGLPAHAPFGPNGMNGFEAGDSMFGSQNQFGPQPINTLPDPWAEARRRNEEHQKARDEEEYRRRLLQQEMLERHYESYSGSDLKPMLTPPGEEYAKLHPRRRIAASEHKRNYMAGLGLWISRVGFEQQAMGEHPYGYAYNNPGTYIDPSGSIPQLPSGGNLTLQLSDIKGNLPSIIPGEVAKAYQCSSYDPLLRINGPMYPRDPDIELARRAISSLLYCIASNETIGFDPVAIGQGPNGKAYGLWQLGDREAQACGAPPGKHAIDYPVLWQLQCALKTAAHQCSHKNKSGVPGSLFAAFEYWAGVVKLRGKSNRNAKQVIDKCMADAGLPNWRDYMKKLPCEPCVMVCYLQNNRGVLVPDPTGGTPAPFPESNQQSGQELD